MQRRKGCLWLLLGLFLALAAGGVAFSAMLQVTKASSTRAQVERPTVDAVVTIDAVPAGKLLGPGDVKLRPVPADLIPTDALRKVEEVTGKIAANPLAANEIVQASRLTDPGKRGRDISFELQNGQVLMAFPAEDLMGSSGLLRVGDRVDVLFSVIVKPKDEKGQNKEGQLVSFDSLQNVTVAGVVTVDTARGNAKAGDQPGTQKIRSILLALSPQDALIVKNLKDTGSIVDLVLRAPADKQRFETQPVNGDFLVDRYRLPVPGTR